MTGNKKRGTQELKHHIGPSNKLSKTNGNSNNRQGKHSDNRWVYSNVSIKRNHIVESDHSSFVKSQKMLRRILSPNPEVGKRSSSVDDNELDHTRTTNGNLDERTIVTQSPIDESFRNILKELTDEIMNYELKVSSLYGRLKEMTLENEKIRNRYTLMCQGVVRNLNNPNSFDRSQDTSDFSSDGETYASDGSETDDELEVGDEEETGAAVPFQNFSKLKGELDLLGSRILERLQELKANERPINGPSSNTSGNLPTDPECIPLVKNLRADLSRSLEELKEVRRFTDVRLSNLKSVLTSERNVSAKARKDIEANRAYAKNASDFVQRANSQLEQYKLVNQTQHNVIISLRKQLANIQEKVQNTPIQSEDNNNNNKSSDGDYCLISEKYHRVLTAYTVLNSITGKQKSDIDLLHNLYEEEKLKSASLANVVEQQRKALNPAKSVSPANVSEVLSKLSALYESRCEEGAKEERMNLVRIATIHDIYKKLMNQKDREHQSIIENLVREFNEFKDTTNGIQKQDPSNGSGDDFDGDIDRVMREQEQDEL